jgi:hypothetical protein
VYSLLGSDKKGGFMRVARLRRKGGESEREREEYRNEKRDI